MAIWWVAPGYTQLMRVLVLIVCVVEVMRDAGSANKARKGYSDWWLTADIQLHRLQTANNNRWLMTCCGRAPRCLPVAPLPSYIHTHTYA